MNRDLYDGINTNELLSRIDSVHRTIVEAILNIPFSLSPVSPDVILSIVVNAKRVANCEPSFCRVQKDVAWYINHFCNGFSRYRSPYTPILFNLLSLLLAHSAGRIKGAEKITHICDLLEEKVKEVQNERYG